MKTHRQGRSARRPRWGLGRALADGSRQRALSLGIVAYAGARIRLGRGREGGAIAWATRERPGSVIKAGHAIWAVNQLMRPGRLPGLCLLRSLVLARLLSAAGAGPVAIRLGVRNTAGEVEAHAWVELAGTAVSDAGDFLPLAPPQRPGRMTE